MSGRATSPPEDAFVSLGANLSPERNIALAAERLTELGRVVALSRVYRSEAVGARGSPDFLNAAVLIRTGHGPRELRAMLRAIERGLGRVRGPDKYAPRAIDLDLCLYGDAIIDDGEILLPDPDVLTRAYLAQTLSELDASRLYPGRDETLGDIASRLRRTAVLQARPGLTERLGRIVGRGAAVPRDEGLDSPKSC